MSKVDKKIKARVAALSEKRVRSILANVVSSYVNGAAQQSSEDIAQFISSDLEPAFKDLDKWVEELEAENMAEMFPDE